MVAWKNSVFLLVPCKLFLLFAFWILAHNGFSHWYVGWSRSVILFVQSQFKPKGTIKWTLSRTLYLCRQILWCDPASCDQWEAWKLPILTNERPPPPVRHLCWRLCRKTHGKALQLCFYNLNKLCQSLDQALVLWGEMCPLEVSSDTQREVWRLPQRQTLSTQHCALTHTLFQF